MTFWDWLFGKKKKSPPEPLVLGAKLRCPHGAAPYSILWVDPGGTIDINHVPQATVEDYIALKNIQPFGQCTTGTEGGECRLHIEFKNPWENPEPQGIMVNGKEAITKKSFLMCSNASTPLVIESSGQDHVYVKHLIFQMEMDQKYGEALRAILDDPNGSLYLNKGMYQIALQFLEDQMKAGQGELSLYMLDDKDSAQSFYIRSALAHLQPAVNPQNLGLFCDGLAAVMGRYDASMREGVDGHVLNAAMMNLLRVDCGKTNELIQAGGFYRWQEENKDSLRLMAAWMKEAEYNALIVGSMMASAAKQGNKERYQEKEGSGERDGSFIDLMDPDEAKRYENYWRQGSGYNVRVTIDDKQVDLIFDKVQGGESTRQRLHTVPGERSIKDVKLGENGEVYIRETIFDEYGRMIGNNDYTNHGRPDIPEHTIPHYHQNPAKNPSQHGSATPGLHPDTPQRR